jgi:hypothetical protein
VVSAATAAEAVALAATDDYAGALVEALAAEALA